ncbi:hypothetical protein [Mameliella alba]|uniref:Uncharacterized protein n=1 Tax=Mameliella alba TaxID=561184 RepID=A0A0B3S0R5_9RHOB|nr:hypothetical protein [Mameliella alba]KHQ50186.1 hypothetical protein OA50_05306 [Mameliella alba]OWV39205.1 hypothetical protein CDZ95_27190 [Mameliella alba]
MSTIAGYLFLSYGPKYAADVTQLPAARKQMRALEDCAEGQHADLKIVAWDYAREIHGPNDLPNLFKLLETCRANHLQNTGKQIIVMDDCARVFRVAQPGAEDALWAALLDYSDYLVGLHQQKPLHALSPELSGLVKFGHRVTAKTKPTKNARPRQDRVAQTHEARQVSARSRRKAARRCAQELGEAFAAYQQAHPDATLKAFLASEGGKILRSSRGKRWTYRNALRVLREEADKQDPAGIELVA